MHENQILQYDSFQCYIKIRDSRKEQKWSTNVKNTKADVIFKDFWRVNEHFADLFNTVVFHGKEILKPEILEEMDTDVSGVIEMKDYKETLSRTRDVIKKTAYGVEFVVLD